MERVWKVSNDSSVEIELDEDLRSARPLRISVQTQGEWITLEQAQELLNDLDLICTRIENAIQGDE